MHFPYALVCFALEPSLPNCSKRACAQFTEAVSGTRGPGALLANHKEDTQVNGAMYSPRNGGVEFVGSDPWAVRLKTHGINRIRIHE